MAAKKRHVYFTAALVTLGAMLGMIVGMTARQQSAEPIRPLADIIDPPEDVLAYTPGVEAAIVKSPFVYAFSSDTTIEETGDPGESRDPYFWLNSGGRVQAINGIGQSLQGVLPSTDRWYVAFQKSHPVDTDGGARPQNLLRLLTRSKWKDFVQQASFRMNRLNVSDSPNRRASNGFIFMSRYVDKNTTYYSGIRVDGTAVIMKKINGTYYVMGSTKQVFASEAKYNRETTPNLMPGQQWIGVKTATKTNPDQTVTIEVFVDKKNNDQWTSVVTATDDGHTFGGLPILKEGMAGIRTDFMDVQFDNYKITNL